MSGGLDTDENAEPAPLARSRIPGARQREIVLTLHPRAPVLAVALLLTTLGGAFAAGIWVGKRGLVQEAQSAAVAPPQDYGAGPGAGAIAEARAFRPPAMGEEASPRRVLTSTRTKLRAEAPSDVEALRFESRAPSGRYGLQLGAFRSRDEAESFVRGHAPALSRWPIYVLESAVPGKGIWYRVRVGSFSSRRKADRVKRRLPRALRASALWVQYR